MNGIMMDSLMNRYTTIDMTGLLRTFAHGPLKHLVSFAFWIVPRFLPGRHRLPLLLLRDSLIGTVWADLCHSHVSRKIMDTIDCGYMSNCCRGGHGSISLYLDLQRLCHRAYAVLYHIYFIHLWKKEKNYLDADEQSRSMLHSSP